MGRGLIGKTSGIGGINLHVEAERQMLLRPYKDPDFEFHVHDKHSFPNPWQTLVNVV